MTDARQVATATGSVCCNCKQEPCACFVVAAPAVPVAGERRSSRPRLVRRYVLPDGSLVNLDEESAAAAMWAGVVPWERSPAG